MVAGFASVDAAESAALGGFFFLLGAGLVGYGAHRQQRAEVTPDTPTAAPKAASIAAPPTAAPPPRPPPAAPLAPLLRSQHVTVPGDAPEGWRPPSHVSPNSRIATLRGRQVVGFAPDLPAGPGWVHAIPDPDAIAVDVGVRYDWKSRWEPPKDTFARRLSALLDDPRAPALRGLIIGPWDFEALGSGPRMLWESLAANGARLAQVEDLFLGEIIREESEISWIVLKDVAPAIHALPGLRHVWVRGNASGLTPIHHAGLRHLELQSGGMGQGVIDALSASHLPELRSLVLWLGDEGYGGTADPASLPALLDRFPTLEHLGLQNADRQDEVIEALVARPGLGRLRSLNLSMGTTTDRGARALLACPAMHQLRWLNLRHHFIQDPALLTALAALPAHVDLSEPHPDDEGYCEVSE